MVEQVFIKTRRKTYGPVTAEFDGHNVHLRSYEGIELDRFYDGYAPENTLYRFVNERHLLMYSVYEESKNLDGTEIFCTVHPITKDENSSLISGETLYSVEEITAVLISLTEKIQTSEASDEVKKEAAATLKKFLRLPVCKNLFGDLTLKVFNAAPPREQYQHPNYSKKKKRW